jgi:hypothetical protein
MLILIKSLNKDQMNSKYMLNLFIIKIRKYNSLMISIIKIVFKIYIHCWLKSKLRVNKDLR